MGTTQDAPAGDDRDHLRTTLETQIDGAVSQIMEQLARLETFSVGSELSALTQELQSTLSRLEAQRSTIGSATGSQLAALQVTLPLTTGNIAANAAQVTHHARGEAVHIVMEMTLEQLAELEQRHIEASERFQTFEANYLDRMNAWAEESGVDISGFKDRRAQLTAEYEEAKRRGDLLGMAEADALRATNLREGLEAVGAPQDVIDQARKEEAAREKDYLQQAGIEARREAEQQGMNPKEVEFHVSAAVEQADTKLDDRRAESLDELPNLMVAEEPEMQPYEVAETTEATAPLPTPNNGQPVAPALTVS